MKIKIADIAERIDDENECGVCDAHKIAYEEIKEEMMYCCPSCGTTISEMEFFSLDTQIIGNCNALRMEDTLRRRYVYKCQECEQRMAIELLPIMYNANHDIYIDGHGYYIADDAEDKIVQEVWKEATEKCSANLEQYTDRLKAGEHNLSPINLTTWNGHVFEEALSTCLKRIFQHRQKV